MPRLYEEEHRQFNLMSHLGDASKLPENLSLEDSEILQIVAERKDTFEYEKGKSQPAD